MLHTLHTLAYIAHISLRACLYTYRLTFSPIEVVIQLAANGAFPARQNRKRTYENVDVRPFLQASFELVGGEKP